MPLLEVTDLRSTFSTDEGEFAAVDGIGFSVEAGRTLAIVGESGCGKSVTALSIMGLVPQPARHVRGSIRFEGRELVGLPTRELQDLRGDRMAMVFQEPMSSLNPAFTIQAQVLDLMHRLQQETGTAIVLITHDLGVVAEVADAVVVMYAGRVVEQAPVQALFAQPQHPYTVGLLGSIPRLHGTQRRLAAIEGQVPSPLHAGRLPFRRALSVRRCAVPQRVAAAARARRRASVGVLEGAAGCRCAGGAAVTRIRVMTSPALAFAGWGHGPTGVG